MRSATADAPSATAPRILRVEELPPGDNSLLGPCDADMAFAATHLISGEYLRQ
jgi:hypothetical protein